jgi:hypothetical protein
VAVALATTAQAQEVASTATFMSSPGPPPPPDVLPSGQRVAPLDMVLERQGDGQAWLVIRYLAPRIARETGDLGYDDVIADLDALCAGPGLVAAAQAAKTGPAPDQIVVTLLDRPVPRGATDPEATLFIEAYRFGPEGCTWP